MKTRLTSYWNIKALAQRFLLVLLLSCTALAAHAQGGFLSTDVLPDSARYRYPLINGASVSVNIFDPVMQVFGVKRASYEATAQADLHHRFFPEFTFGLGRCNEKSDNNERYKTNLSPFFKVGMAYNFKYNDLRPDYYYTILVRYGFGHSKANLSGLSYTDGYWNEFGPASITGQSINSHWVEFGFGIKVKIYKNISMGWDIFFKPIIKKGSTRMVNPYFIPGYGTTNTKLGLDYRIYFDLFKRRLKTDGHDAHEITNN